MRAFWRRQESRHQDRRRLSLHVASLAKLNCAGQGCPERGGCRRYVLRIPDRKERGQGGLERPVFEWGSFDVERELTGRCDSLVVLRRGAVRGEA